MSLETRLTALATRVSAECKSLWTAVNGKAPTVHTHVATTDLTATGTKNGTTFLRGDNTWVAPPTGTAIQPNEPPTSVLWIDTDENYVTGPQWVMLTQAAYDALPAPVPDTLYVVVG